MRLPFPTCAADSTDQKLYLNFCSATGYAAVSTLPPSGSILALFQSGTGFEILVDLRGWGADFLGDKGGFATEYVTEQEIRDLFHFSGACVSMLLSDGTSEQLTMVRPVMFSELPGPLPGIETTTGLGWVLSVPAGQRNKLKAHLPAYCPGFVKIRLDYVLGCSSLSLRAVSRLTPGDVLIIERFQEEIMYGRCLLGKYRHQENDVVIDDIYVTDKNEVTMTEHNETPFSQGGLNNLPLHLDFVIHQTTVPLSQLMTLSPGDVLPAGAIGPGQVMIRANGTLIARGELIWVEEQLCVEIQTLYHEAEYGK